MPVGIQFTASLDPGQFQVWATSGWGRELRVEWSVRPSPGQVGNVVLRALTVEAVNDGTLTYHLTVWNIASTPVTFDALYEFNGVDASSGVPNPVGLWDTTVLPQTFTDSGDGVLGEGQNGVHGRSRSPTDSGVWGENTNAGFGVTGSTNAGTGQRGTIAGVWGSNPGAGAGVRGTGGKTGVLGEGDGSSGSIGVEGKSANEGVGVHGEGAVGVHGISNFSGGLGFNAGVHAEHTANGFGLLANTNGGVGVAAVGHNKTGVLGEGDGSLGSIGVEGKSANEGVGVHGAGGSVGVFGEGALGVHGKSNVSGGLGLNAGVSAEHTANGIGLLATAIGGTGVVAAGALGGTFSGTTAPLRLSPSAVAGKPVAGRHEVGELYVDSTGTLFFCSAGGIPGTWKQIQLV